MSTAVHTSDQAPSPIAVAGEPSSVALLITIVASVASVAMVLLFRDIWRTISPHPGVFAIFLALTLALQLASVDVYGRGRFGFGGAGLLALGFAFGPGAAVITLARTRQRVHRAIFNAGALALASGAGAGAYRLIGADHWTTLARLGPAALGGALFLVLNIGLLSTVMSLSENRSVGEIWRGRFRWITPYYLASGPLGLALVIAYQKTGVTGLVAFALPPAFMMLSVRQYLEKTRQSVEEVRQANEELSHANVTLAERNEDLRELFEFAGGLAARAHDRNTLVSFAQLSLSRMTGTQARISGDPDDGQFALEAGGARVGSLELTGTALDVQRWERLREAILPQLATALESTDLIEQVRKKHLATIAALSRSMEAKDYYTGGHTERVSEVAVAIARRLDFDGADLDAIEIGALLHDIGKIGIPERILHKAGPLDDEEWKVMKEHPVISDYILSEVDLHPFVRQIARWSHERVDGKGYPDGLSGEQIPLPARIALVADAYDALTSDRPYRRGRHVAAAIEELREHAGTQFCARCVSALEDVWREEPHLLGAGHLRAVQAGAA
jgi:HD-GYP domain-containing protein (c-di-GMP phosphodiesterase class II)